VGAGFEDMFARNWSVKGEYLYLDFGNLNGVSSYARLRWLYLHQLDASHGEHRPGWRELSLRGPGRREVLSPEHQKPRHRTGLLFLLRQLG
jgi:hypothetical protein